MPKITAHGGESWEAPAPSGAPAPSDPDLAPIVVDEHGDDAAAVDPAAEPVVDEPTAPTSSRRRRA